MRSHDTISRDVVHFSQEGRQAPWPSEMTGLGNWLWSESDASLVAGRSTCVSGPTASCLSLRSGMLGQLLSVTVGRHLLNANKYI